MGLCDDPGVKKERKKRFRTAPKSSGLNAGHRTRTQPSVVTEWSDWVVLQPEDLAHAVDPVLMSVASNHQIMHDTHGYIQNWYNPVCHEKYEGVPYDIPTIVDEDGPIMSFGNSPGFLPIIQQSCPFLTENELTELALESRTKLVKVVSTTTDLFNFLRELIEFCYGNIRIIKRFASLWERMQKAFEDAYKRARAQGHKEAAAYWLAWNFAIKPFLSDLRNLLCAMSALHKKMDWLRKTNRKVFYQTFTREFDLPVEDVWVNGLNFCNVTKADPPEMANGAYTQQFKYYSVKLKYVARAKLRLNLPDHLLDEMHGGVGALWAAYHGLTNPVGVIWEAIPFSWLIDYFLNFRSRLFQTMYDFNPFNEGVEVLGFGHSFKLHVIGTGRVCRDTGSEQLGWAEAGRVDYLLYRREAGLPYEGQASYFRVPSDWYKLSIIGSVVIGRLPGRRRRKSR